MPAENKTQFPPLFEVLAECLRDKTLLALKHAPTDPIIFHYSKEIIRYWNKLNFVILHIFKKFSGGIQEAFGKIKRNQSKKALLFQAILFYVSYRMLWEHASTKILLEEIPLTLFSQISGFSIKNYLKYLQTFNWERNLKNLDPINSLSIEAAIPKFFIERLQPVMDINSIIENLRFMDSDVQEGISTIRINLLTSDNGDSTSISEIISFLEQLGVKAHADAHIPYLFHVASNKKRIILQSEFYKSGQIIFQDKASAMVAWLLDPQSTDFLCDLCAAPGLKTSFLAQSSLNMCRIVAIDFHQLRIFEMKTLLNQFKIPNIYLLNADGINPPLRPKIQFDRILLDAPCTGSGTFSVYPDFKWRQTRKFLEQNVYLQEKLLTSAIQLLKPRGILVYSTCSLYPEEGELQILKHLKSLKPLPLPNWLSASYLINNQKVLGSGRLFPAIHQTQGFFIGKYEKSG